MAYTKQTTVNSTPENITAQTKCKSIVFGEDEAVAGWPTVAWAWRAPDATDFKGKSSGTKEEWAKPGGAWYEPGEVVAVVKTPSGSSTFTQAES